jgi:hypothetical protein
MHTSFEIVGNSQPGKDGFLLLATAAGLVRGVVPSETVDHDWLRAGLAAMDRSLAWEAVRHKVGRLVLSWMRHNGVAGRPQVQDALKTKVMADTSTRLLLLRHWPALVRLLAEEGIPCLTLKGPAASIQLHGDPAEREFVDLDLLVDLPDPGSLAPVLARAGFLPMDRSSRQDLSRLDRRLFRSVHHAGFLHRDLPVHVEIHGRDGFKNHEELFPVSAAELFRQAVGLVHDGQTLLTLDPVHHSLFMIAHGIKHAWGLLLWALDGAAILSPARAAWHPAILERGKELGMSRMLAVSAAVVQRTFGAPLPAGFAALTNDRHLVPVPALRHCLERLENGSRGHQSIPTTLKHGICHLGAVAGGRWFSLRLFLDLFKITAADLDLVRLPRSFFFLYLPLRPVFVVYRRMVRLMAPELMVPR